jgi:hypothetical protein
MKDFLPCVKIFIARGIELIVEELGPCQNPQRFLVINMRVITLPRFD